MMARAGQILRLKSCRERRGSFPLARDPRLATFTGLIEPAENYVSQ